MSFHTAIPVQDIQRSKKFYEQLGFVFLKDWQRLEEGLHGVQLQNAEGCILELVHHQTNTDIQMPKLTEVMHIGLSVADIHQTLNSMSQLGVKIIRPVTVGVSVKWIVFIEDPDGFPIELFQEQV